MSSFSFESEQSRDTLLLKIAANLAFVAFDFDGVFTDNSVYVFEDGREAVRCSRADGLGLRKLRALNIQSIIISTEANPVVSARARKLGIECVQNCEDKLQTLNELLGSAGLTLRQAAFVGNDFNDRECLLSVGLPIVVQDAHADVVGLGVYRTRAPGGHGAVREVCDLIAEAFSHNK